MTIPFWPPRPAWSRAIADATAVMVVVDFDGTLSPIAGHPAKAVLAPGMGASLDRLSRVADLAVMSGRARADLARKIGSRGIVLGGDHGRVLRGPQGLRRGGERPESHRLLREWAENLRDRFRAVPGVFIERKEAGVAVHYRQVASRDRARFVEAMRAARRRAPWGWRWESGSCVWELRRRGSDKGRALAWLWKKKGRPYLVCVGDDVTDEDLFRFARGRGLSVKVGTGTTRAVARVRSPAGVRRLLNWVRAVRS